MWLFLSVLCIFFIHVYIHICIYIIYDHSKPFADEGSSILRWFLPQHYAMAIPATLLMVGLCGIAIFITLVFRKEAEKKKTK